MTRRIALLDLTREYTAIAAELQSAWNETLGQMNLFGGPALGRFEREIAAYVGARHAIGVGSGTDAQLLGMSALGIGRGDRVVLPANAFVAALEAVHRLGARPVLVDTETDGFAPDMEAIGAALPAKAVVVVHLYGHVFDLSAIEHRARAHGTLLLEDASHAHGAERAGGKAGSIGAVGCFSASVVKNLGAYGDAGFVVTESDEVADEIRLLRNHGQRTKNEHVRYGCNSRLDELQAAVLLVKLRHLDARNRRRRAIAAHYDASFAGLDLRLPLVAPDERAVFHQYVVRSGRRDRLREHLASRGIETGIHYPTPLHRQAAWLREYGEHPPLPRAEKLASQILSLPVFPDLTDAEVEDVVRAVCDFHGTRPRRLRRSPLARRAGEVSPGAARTSQE
jgi:dTDP-4-amino-4,6-dideoxygalactose transaminase